MKRNAAGFVHEINIKIVPIFQSQITVGWPGIIRWPRYLLAKTLWGRPARVAGRIKILNPPMPPLGISICKFKSKKLSNEGFCYLPFVSGLAQHVCALCVHCIVAPQNLNWTGCGGQAF
jgi:hypothetical protein